MLQVLYEYGIFFHFLIAQVISVFVFPTRIVQFFFYCIRNYSHLAFFCYCTGQFVSDLVGNPEDWFSHVAGHIINLTLFGSRS